MNPPNQAPQPPPSSPPEGTTTPILHDLLIIGAGPCGLAVAARLREETPSAMFTDDEHQRYHWINKHRGRMTVVQAHGRARRGVRAEKYQSPSISYNMKDDESSEPDLVHSRSSSISSSSSSSSSSSFSTDSTSRNSSVDNEDTPTTLILDSTGARWMERWNRAFQTLEIQQLRSPMFFHVDPRDRDGMLAYTQETSRGKDLWEISGIPAEPEIDERDRKDYFSPSTGLFADYCNSIVARYKLNTPGQIRPSEATDIQFTDRPELFGEAQGKIFTTTAADGTQHYSRALVLATGAGGQPNLPFPLTPTEQQGACHSSQIRGFPSAHVQTKIRQGQPTHLVVVGGGLTSAQIVDMAIKKGVRRVWLLMRSDFKVKHFDLTLNWMGKFKNLEKARFWSADTDEERLEMIQAARGGGSITPRYQKILKQHVATGRVAIHPQTSITGRRYCAGSRTWRLQTEPPIPALQDTPVDYIYFATGMRADVNEMPLLHRMLRDYPVDTSQGLPCLTEDLMWDEGVPLFVTGRMAALRLGPGAANLEGARLGAERIAWAMEDVLGRRRRPREGERECFCGLGNRFAGLVDVDVEG
ncbi:FAD binding domain protein [Aspergillus saccharolyticus JOP 1030-1]|uniref:L-ornithine N(5)-monooxygenase n=1 Tax=Aspergillus saccharolyticus JOP 1030-1 TaxID=1450539 RepID=A0A318Z2Z2_9EURO|nr:hypothetical protein BP01DRAFT_395167 [Aspergillus saccharolyticus JOP 1030-1]PYH41369.1 hypothetical protein BP01DRAFT_395167 [Aspergillus saccharolyticus JOP 1030-1]